MAGFMLNGFGAADSYYMVKELTGKECVYCGKTDMALMELRMKIRIVYIPTLTIGKKFAVCCPKCKNGFYVDDAQRSFILNHDSSCVQVSKEGLRLVDEDEAEALPEENAADVLPEASAEPEKPAAAPAPKQEEPAAARCACGAELIPGALFCMKCGAKVAKSAAPAPVEAAAAPAVKAAEPIPAAPQASSFVYKKPQVCPECGMHVTGQKDTCSICGAKLS